MRLTWHKLNFPQGHLIGGALLALVLLAAVLATNNIPPFQNINFGSSGVTVEKTEVIPDQVTAEQPAAFTVTFANSSRRTETVLIDIELFDQQRNRVHQEYWDNVSIRGGGTVSYQISTPAGLAPGRYRFWVGIFQPGWGRVYRSYDVDYLTISQEDTPVIGPAAITLH